MDHLIQPFHAANPVCTKPLSDCSEMGNDGGSIQKRSEMVKVKQKDAVIDDAEIIKTLWTCCYLSKEPLERPVVACGLGRLYNKDAVVKYLLNKTTSIPEFEHIRSLKSVFEVKLTDSTAPGSPYFACPLTGREMNGKSRFVVVKGCGCVFAEQALRELPATGRCLLCERDNNGGAMEIIPLNGKPEEIQELRRSLKPSKKRASSSDDKPAPAKPVVEENKAKALLEEIQSTTLGIQTLKKNKVLESIYK